MKRQFDYTVGPGGGVWAPGCRGGGVEAQNWENKHIFERWGDDNTVYFTDTVDQAFLAGAAGPAPWTHQAGAAVNAANNYLPSGGVALTAPANHTATTFLCEESHNVKRKIILEPGANAKVFLDAWEHYQTVPLMVQVAASGGNVPYQWSFHNYLPLGGGPMKGAGLASSCLDIDTQPPIVQTLGQTDRSPTGEYPVSEATKARTCCCASERPFFYISNTGSDASLVVVVKVAQ